MTTTRVERHGPRKAATAALLLACGALAGSPVATAQGAAGLCPLVPGDALAALGRDFSGRLSDDEPVQLTPQQVPGLPAALRIEQCTTDMRRSGAIGFRAGLVTAARALSAAEWDRTERALDEGQAPPPGTPGRRCWRGEAGVRGGVRLHEAGCQAVIGSRRLVSVSFEHEQADLLPAEPALLAVLERLVAQLPR